MPSSLSNFAWGILFNIFYVSLVSICTVIFRASAPLSTSVAFVFLFLGETVGTLPLLPIAWRNWTVRSTSRWATFILLGFLTNAVFILWRACVNAMHLGTFMAISGSSLFFVPAVTAILQRRCVSVVDFCGVCVACIGLLLVTHPPFLFNEPVEGPAYAYAFAILEGIINASFPFFFGATADAHWSNFLVLRVGSSAVVAVVLFGLSGGVAAFAASPLTPLFAVFVVGVVSNVYRLAQQVGCSELEEFDAGLAGLFGNIINAVCIPLTTLMSLAFFGENLTTVESVGVALVFVATIGVTVAKGCLGQRKDEKEDEKIILTEKK